MQPPREHAQKEFHRFVVRETRYVLENTMQPFEPGDVFLSCTWLNDPTDDHAGLGRILQYDRDLRPKGVLWTEGHRHLLIGLVFDPKGVLWGFDIHTHAVIRVDRYGRQMPMRRIADRAFGSAVFASDGSIYFGENLQGTSGYWGSYMTYLPGTDRVGDGRIFRFGPDLQCLEEYEVENAPELTGFKGVTHMALHPSERFITYTTETGKRIMRFDLRERRQMPDLARIEGGTLTDRNWYVAVAYRRDGTLLVSRGSSIEALDEQGRVLRAYDLSKHGYGFAQITVSKDGRHAFTANVFTGIACKLDLESGEIVGVIHTDHQVPRRSLAGIAEF